MAMKICKSQIKLVALKELKLSETKLQTYLAKLSNQKMVAIVVSHTTKKLSYVMTCRVVKDINLQLHTLTKY